MEKTNPPRNRKSNPDFTGQEYIMKVRKPRQQPPRKPRICPKCKGMAKEFNELHKTFDSISQLVSDFGAMKLENVEKKYTFAHLVSI